MKIKSIETIQLKEFPLIVWVQINTNEGVTGLGETYFAPNAVSQIIHNVLSPLLINKNPLNIEEHWRNMFDMTNAFGYAGAEARAISAIDIALWDISAQVAGQPIYNLLGGKCRDKIMTYNTAGQYGDNTDSIDAILNPVKLANSLIDQGINSMKWAYTDHFADLTRGTYISNEDLNLLAEPIKKIREEIGFNFEIANDGHGRWNLSSAIKIGKRLDDYNMLWQEELIQPVNVESHIKLADELEAPVCVSERLITKYQFRDYLKQGAIEIVMPDLIWTGGITETKKISTLAEAEQLPVAPHDMTGPVNIFACAHISMNIPNAFIMETCRAFYEKNGWYNKIVDKNIQVIDGYLLAPEGIGLGTSLKKEIFNRDDLIYIITDTNSDNFHWGGFTSSLFEVVSSNGEKSIKRKL
ncbi:MAG: mandelate racemase/muconate lactonizing enzyme family protein [Dehalococcoidia bacterium]